MHRRQVGNVYIAVILLLHISVGAAPYCLCFLPYQVAEQMLYHHFNTTIFSIFQCKTNNAV